MVTMKLLMLGLAITAAGCSDGGDDGATDEVVAAYAQHVATSYGNMLTGAKAMKTSIDAFLAAPSATTLEAARAGWKAAREPYLVPEVFRFYDGPIDAPEPRINSWPLDEVFIDYVQG